jgi:hypothetical protein
MIRVRLAIGTIEDHGVQFDGEWPVVPRVGEKVSILDDRNDGFSYLVTEIHHQAMAKTGELIGVIAIVEPL